MKQIHKFKHFLPVANLNMLKGFAELEMDFAILLNGPCISRKNIWYFTKTKHFKIFNWIDDSKQVLTEKQLFNKTETNIGKALKAGALYIYLDDYWEKTQPLDN